MKRRSTAPCPGATFVAAFACALALVPVAIADAIEVTNTHNAGPGSLRKAIQKANDEGGAVIDVNATGTIGLQSELPAIASDVTLNGPSSSNLIVTRAAGAPAFRIFRIEAGEIVLMRRLTVRGGKSTGMGGAGGGIYNLGSLALKSVIVAKNKAVATAASFSASGGGIYNTGSLQILTSRITANKAVVSGGAYPLGSGIMNSGTVEIYDSTIDHNAGNSGIYSSLGSMLIENVTIADNDGNGVIVAAGDAAFISTTIAHNAGIPGFARNVWLPNAGATASFQNSIVAEPPPGGSDCDVDDGASMDSVGYSLTSDGTCPFTGGSDDVANPKLGDLTDNGGPTPTMALPKSSPAVDDGNIAIPTDQRKKPRPVDFPGIPNEDGGNGSDIGAFELQN